MDNKTAEFILSGEWQECLSLLIGKYHASEDCHGVSSLSPIEQWKLYRRLTKQEGKQ